MQANEPHHATKKVKTEDTSDKLKQSSRGFTSEQLAVKEIGGNDTSVSLPKTVALASRLLRSD